MNKYIIDRVIEEANYILKHKSTVRDIASIFNVSKSTVHKDLQDRLRDINEKLHYKVNKVFREHIEVRHLRGGASTKRKYSKI